MLLHRGQFRRDVAEGMRLDVELRGQHEEAAGMAADTFRRAGPLQSIQWSRFARSEFH
jgi:hypothetical protein